MSRLRESIKSKITESIQDDEEQSKWYKQDTTNDDYPITEEFLDIACNYIQDRLRKDYEIDDIRWGEIGFMVPIFYMYYDHDQHRPMSRISKEFTFYFSNYDSREEAKEDLMTKLDDFVHDDDVFTKK